jgi:hypothetical protein
MRRSKRRGRRGTTEGAERLGTSAGGYERQRVLGLAELTLTSVEPHTKQRPTRTPRMLVNHRARKAESAGQRHFYQAVSPLYLRSPSLSQ